MPTVHLSPIGNDTPFYSGGTQLNAGSLYTYLAGTTTLATTYTNEGALTANSNPIVLNSEGYPSNGAARVQIWLTAGTAYKFLLKDADGVTLWSMDDIDGINDINLISSEWVSVASNVTVLPVNATNFTLSGDQTGEALPNRWIKSVNSGGTVYSIIISAQFATVTTVTVVNVGTGVLDSGLSALQYGVLRPDHPSAPLDVTHLKASTITAAATTSIWSANGNYAHVTGATGITSFIDPLFPPRPGARRRLVIDSGLTITHNASTLICPGGASLIVPANGVIDVMAESTTSVRVASFAPGAPSGAVMDFAGASAPSGWLECDGATVLKTDYPALYVAIGIAWGSLDSDHFTLPDFRGRMRMGKGTGGLSYNLAGTPSADALVVTSNADKFITGMAVSVSNSTGFTGTGLTDLQTRYIIRIDDTHIKFTDTLVKAQNGLALTLTGGPGTATIAFTLSVRALAANGGQEQHLISSAEMPAHTHTLNLGDSAGGGGRPDSTTGLNFTVTNTTSSAGGTVSANITPPYAVTMAIIKT